MEIIHDIIHVAKSNRFAFPSLNNFNSFRKKNARILPSYIHIYIISFIRKIAQRRDHFFRNYLCSSPSQIRPSFHPKILLSHLRFRFDQINKHDRSALPRIHVTRRAFDFEDRNRERRTREITSEADLFHFRPVILCVTLE